MRLIDIYYLPPTSFTEGHVHLTSAYSHVSIEANQ